MAVIAGWERRVRAVLTREVAGRHWDGLLWSCGAVGLLGIVLSSFVPAVSELAVLFSVTLFANGPYGALLPALQEPIVMVSCTQSES